MDLVSFEDPEEYRHFAKIMHLGETARGRLIEQFYLFFIVKRN
jgi:hypothetical protein